MSHAESLPEHSLAPLPYHPKFVEFLHSNEPELWKWASNAQCHANFADEVRTNLLKENYRLDAAGHPDLSARCTAVAQRLGISAPVTLYQSNGGLGMNAMLCFLPDEAHVVFTGPILSHLQGNELDAVIAHELAHHHLWEIDNGAFLAADRILLGAVSDPRSVSSHAQTARRFRLYTEIFADRGSFLGSGDLHAAVAALVKTETGFAAASAESYLRQADEIFSKENATTKGIEHPETFIRARALRLWVENDPGLDEWLAATIETASALDAADLPGQERMTQLTRRFLRELLRPRWFQTPAILAHARAYFPDFSPSTQPDEQIAADFRLSDPGGREFQTYLLLDFAAADPALEDLPLAAALQWSERLEIAEVFEKAASKELGIGKRQLAKLKKESATLLASAEGMKP